MYLLDTNVISELRKAKRGRCDVHVQQWAAGVSTSSLYLSAISLMELEIGVLQMERRDQNQGALLREWLDSQVKPAFDDRILAIDSAVVLRCAKLHVPNPVSDRDALIAATALVHGMTLVTRNVDDFSATDVALLNPWYEIVHAS